MNNNKKILLISYVFPPYPGIGGRRWAKFSKYLTKLGYEIHVIHAENPFLESSLWLEDIDKNDNIKRYALEDSYPKSLLGSPKTIFERLNYHYSLFKVKLLSKGTPYDRGVFLKEKLLNKSIQIITEFDIRNVIVSSAPFSATYYTLELKKQFPSLNLIVDFRDPWTWGSSYGFSKLNIKRMAFEKEKEHNVISQYDSIMVPSVKMKEDLSFNYKDVSNRIYVIPHGFDEDEVLKEPKKISSKTNLMFYGTLYPGLENVFLQLSNAIKASHGKLSLDIYSSSKTYNQFFIANGLDKSVNYLQQVRPKELFRKFSNYNYIVVVQPDHAKDFITTKIYEIIYTNTPIILISNEGKLSQFIISNCLGIWFSPNELYLLNERMGLVNQTYKWDEFPIDDFSFRRITSKVTDLLK